MTRPTWIALAAIGPLFALLSTRVLDAQTVCGVDNEACDSDANECTIETCQADVCESAGNAPDGLPCTGGVCCGGSCESSCAPAVYLAQDGSTLTLDEGTAQAASGCFVLRPCFIDYAANIGVRHAITDFSVSSQAGAAVAAPDGACDNFWSQAYFRWAPPVEDCAYTAYLPDASLAAPADARSGFYLYASGSDGCATTEPALGDARIEGTWPNIDAIRMHVTGSTSSPSGSVTVEARFVRGSGVEDCNNGVDDDCDGDLDCADADCTGVTCDDGDACTQTDACDADSGACVGSDPISCAPADDACEHEGACNPGTGECEYAVMGDDSACDDGDACTRSDTCQSGICSGADPVACAAPDACHEEGVCSASTGECEYAAKADGSACEDAKICRGGECIVVGDGDAGTGSDADAGVDAGAERDAGGADIPGLLEAGAGDGVEVDAGADAGAGARDEAGSADDGSCAVAQDVSASAAMWPLGLVLLVLRQRQRQRRLAR